MSVQIHQGHAIDVLAELPERSVQLCVTSPPYLWLRAYGTPPQVWPSEEASLCEGEHEWGDVERIIGPGKRGDTRVRWSHTGIGQSGHEYREGNWCARCGAWRGELGSEPTVELYLAHLVQVFRSVKRVLRDDGLVFCNLAGCYFNNPGGQNGGANNTLDYHAGRISPKAMEANRQAGRQDRTGRVPRDYWLKPLDYVDVPGLFARAMQADGWLWRSDISLVKRSPMPESIQGVRWERCRIKLAKNKHCDPQGRGGQQRMLENPEDNRGINPDWLATYEDCPGCSRCESTDGYVLRRGNGRPTRAWERLLIFAKKPGYFWDTESVREPQQSLGERHEGKSGYRNGHDTRYGFDHRELNPAGRNLRDWQFWEHESLKEQHYAAFGSFIPRLAFRAGTSRAGACGVCGAPWARVVERSPNPGGILGEGNHRDYRLNSSENPSHGRTVYSDTRTLAWRPTCSCKDAGPPVPCVVLDCFGGSGTTALVAQEMGLDCVLVDLNPTYTDMAARRNTNGYTRAETDGATGSVMLRQMDLFSYQGQEAGE